WRGPRRHDDSLTVRDNMSGRAEGALSRSSAPGGPEAAATALDRAPATQVLHRRAVLPLDGVFERVRQPATERVAGHLGHAACRPDRDDQALVVERERAQRLAEHLGLEVV